MFNSVFGSFLNDFRYPLGSLSYSKNLKNRVSGWLEADIKKESEKHLIFERLEPRKVSPRAGGSMILRFCPTPGKCSILEVFWYLLLQPLGSPILEKMLFKGCFIFVRFLHRLLCHFRPPKWPPNHVKWRSIFGTIFYRSAGLRSGMIAVPSPPGTPLSFNLSSMGTGSAINYESLANICKKFPQTLTEFTYISICLIII